MSPTEYDYAIAGRPLVEIDDAGLPVARRARVADIIQIAANLSGVTPDELTGKRQFRRICRVRFAVYVVARENGHSTPVVAHRLGNRDHSTVVHGCHQVAEYVKRDPDYAAFVAELRAAAAVAKPFVPVVAVAPPVPPPEEAAPPDHDEEQGIASRQNIRAGSRALAAAIAEARAA